MNRLFEIVLILLEKEKVTTKELADYFEISRRTVLRDIDKLLVAGVPIMTQSGYEGGISIEEGYQLDKQLISTEERETILQGLQAMDSVSTTPVLPTFINKLLGHTNTVPYNEVIDIDLSSWYGYTLIPKIEIIKQSIINQTKLTFLYYSNASEEYKKVSPIKISFRWSSWYLVGICNKANDIRYYKLNRIDKLEKTEELFESYTIEHQQEDYFNESKYHVKAIFNPKVKYRLVDDYGIHSFIEKEDGIYFERGFVNKEYLISWILSFGSDVMVLEPKELHQEIKNKIKDMNKVYECDI
ncbi:MAG: helix-turn-helix transcriptional regulator [Coprobacillaceae bacterium]